MIRSLRPEDAPGCDAVVRSLPEWFGFEEGIRACADAVRTRSGWVAELTGGELVGFLVLREHYPGGSEIDWAGVHAAHRHRGIGRRLVDAAEAHVRAEGLRWLHLLTVSPNDVTDRAAAGQGPYVATRAFWERCGFEPLRDLSPWPGNLAVLYVKRLA